MVLFTQHLFKFLDLMRFKKYNKVRPSVALLE